LGNLIHRLTVNEWGKAKKKEQSSSHHKLKKKQHKPQTSNMIGTTALKASHRPLITLYQYAICPFCNINKALLAYTNTPHKITEVNPLTKSQLPSKDYRKVPIATIDNVQINGSKEINEALLNLPSLQNNIDLPLGGFNSANAQRWETFAREELAPVLYPNICKSLGESYEAFGYVEGVEEFSRVQKVLIRGVGSLAMYYAAGKIKGMFERSFVRSYNV